MTLVDGKAHSVDSSDAAFQTAGALAVQGRRQPGTVQLLEPIEAVTITVPDDYVGAVMSDLSGRRGRVTGTEPVGGERPLVSAEVPAARAAALRRRPAVDHRRDGHASPARYLRHDPMPEHEARKAMTPQD